MNGVGLQLIYMDLSLFSYWVNWIYKGFVLLLTASIKKITWIKLAQHAFVQGPRNKKINFSFVLLGALVLAHFYYSSVHRG